MKLHYKHQSQNNKKKLHFTLHFQVLYIGSLMLLFFTLKYNTSYHNVHIFFLFSLRNISLYMIEMNLYM